ncbi:uncharacterized protein B0T15DRAFT_491922 [Chaetomium strumarium]|uniref:Uncharacterized protein n=1 Tax=Chaetomium strumarium TaxID=1170767 RepID=A0AAJ0GUE4_9PEZI|nr:hypothetical protein B0T15DRAFT_491922 [Chaetomium strumarium]
MDLLIRLLVLSLALAPVPISCSPAELPEPPAPAAVNVPLTSAPPPAAVVERREALDIGPPPPPPGNIDFQPVPPSNKGCTTTVTETYGFPCEWNGTLTTYPAGTTTQFRQVNCNGCDAVYVSKSWYYCPNQKINATRAMDVPSTYWSTICRPSTAAALRDRDPQQQQQQQTAARPTAVPESGAYQTAMVPGPDRPVVVAALPTPSA